MYNNNTARTYAKVPHFPTLFDGTPAITDYYGFKPLKKGDHLPGVTHPTSHFIYPGSLEPGVVPKDLTPISLSGLSNGNKPLVILFRPSVNHVAIQHLPLLNRLHRDIQIMGGSLLVISNASIRDLNRQLDTPNQLWVLSDPHNSLAEQFGLYTPDNPIGDWLSGIEDNISLPAFFVILPNGEISFSYVDYNFSTYQDDPDSIYQQAFIRQLLTRIYQDTQQFKRYHKTAFKHG